MKAPLPDNEAARLAVLREHRILDTAPTAEFDDLVRLAAQLCGVPIAAVSLIDEDRQWFKSITGLDGGQTPREVAFCAYTILGSDLLIVPDAHADARFADNPQVTGDPHIRFYAGAPLLTEDGHCLGSLCIIDRKSRLLPPDQAETLRLLARQAAFHLQAARRLAEREQLAAENARLAAIVSTSGDAIYSKTLSGDVLSWNKGAERLYGYTAAEIVGKTVDVIIPPELRQEMADCMEQIRQGAAVPVLETVRLTKTGERLHVLLSLSPVPAADGSGRVIGASLIASDITPRKQVEEKLDAEREFTHALLESMQEGIVACDADGVLSMFNPAARSFHGLSEEALKADKWAERFSLYRADGLTPLPTEEIPLFRAFSGESVRDAEIVIAPQGAPSRTILSSGQAIYSRSGKKLGAVVAMHDITVRRRIAQELSRLAAIVESSEEAIFAMTLDGTIASWNGGAARLYGYGEEEMIGRHASALAVPGESRAIDEVVASLLAGKTLAPLEGVRRRRDGSNVQVGLTYSPIRDGGGRIIGLSCIARDITARREAEAALRESEARLRHLSDAAFEGIAVSQNGVMIDANPAFLTLYGYDSQDQVAGLSVEQFAVPEVREIVRQKVLSDNEDAYEALCLRRDGSTFPAEVRGRRAVWNGQPARVTAIRDITERRAMEDALQESRRFALSIAENSASIIYVYDLQSQKNVYANRNVMDLLGYTSKEMTALGAEFLTTVIHPDDLPRVKAHLERFHTLKDGDVIELEYRAKNAGGEYCWLWKREVVFKRTPDGAPWQILSNAQDITERKAMEDALRRSEEAMRAVLGAAPVILYAADTDGTITLSEGTGLASLGLKPGEAVGRSVWEFSTGSPEALEKTRRALAGETVSYDMRLGALCLHIELRPQRDSEGAVCGIIGVSFDVTERKKIEEQLQDYMVVLEHQKIQLEESNRELESLATTDGLTGLKNHRTFQAKLAEEFARSVRYQQPLSLLLLDVDHFKRYNDSFGHPAGDAVLRQVADALRGSARDTDVPARYGGEEFVVILPLTDEAGALAFAERVRLAIAGADWAQRPVTVSLGVSTLTLDTPSAASLIALADGALYLSKEAGRNCATHGNPAAPLLPLPKPPRRRRPVPAI